MMDLISIIVPVYKVEKYLDKCVQSIMDQTYTNLEIILVDDGSPDNCPQMCDEWAKKDSRIKVIHKKNGGPSAARNAALDIAKGEYLYFVDSDDYIETNLCEKIMCLFQQVDADIVTFDCNMVDENGENLGSTERIRDGMIERKNALLELLKGNINNYSCNKVYKKQVFDGIRFPEDIVMGEDIATTYKLFLNANQIYCCTEKLYYYVQRKNSIVHTIGEKALRDLFLARYESYLCLKEIYPEVGELAFAQSALCALRLYDRSLWAEVDTKTLEMAKLFLQENRSKVLSDLGDIHYRMYYYAPGFYKLLRLGKHGIGEILRRIGMR